jgi:PEP-CTERM motif
MAEGHGIFLETFQLNFGAAGAVFPTDETSIDMIFPHNVFTLGTIPVSFSGTFAPYQGSNEAFFDDGQSYDFYISKVDANAVPEPATWAMMLIGFASLGFGGYRRAKTARATCVRLAH